MGSESGVENHQSSDEEDEEETDESELDSADEVDSSSSSTPTLPDSFLPLLDGNDQDSDKEKTDKLSTRISNMTLKPETATQNSRPSTSTLRGRIEIVRKVIRKYFCKICMAEVPSLEGLRVHLDRQHKIRVKGAPRIADHPEEDDEGERQTAALERVSGLIKSSEAQPRTIEPLVDTEQEHETESDPWSDCDDYDDLAGSSLPYPRMKESVVTAMTKREARWALEIEEERGKPGFLKKLEGYTQCSSCCMELSLDPRSSLLREQHERLHSSSDGSCEKCPHCAMPFLYHAQLEEHLQDLSVPTIPSDLFEGVEEEGEDVLYESHPCEREGCGAEFKNRRCLLFHKTLQHDSLHRCPICEKPFVFYSALRGHIEQRHNWEKRLLPCLLPLCGKAFESKRALISHTTHGHPLPKGKEINQDDTPHHHPPQSFWRKVTSNLIKDREFRAKKKKKENASLPPLLAARSKLVLPPLAPFQVQNATPLLHSLSPRADLAPRSGTFQRCCPLCSQKFWTNVDRNEHLGRTHGLDLSLPKPFICKECRFATKMGWRLIAHLRDKHPGADDDLLRRSLAEAVEGGELVDQNSSLEVDEDVDSTSFSSSRRSLTAHLRQFQLGGDGSRVICPACPPSTHSEEQRTYKTVKSMIVHLRTQHPDSPHLHPDTAAEGVAKRSRGSISIKKKLLPRKRRALHWKKQLKLQIRLLQKTGEKAKNKTLPPPLPSLQKQSEEEVDPESEEEYEVPPPSPSPTLDLTDDDDEVIAVASEERAVTPPPPPHSPGIKQSLSPLPNLLFLSLKDRLRIRNSSFPHICSLCSRSFRNMEDRAEHYSGKHGLDLTLSCPLICPVEECGYVTTVAEGGRLLFHIQAKHPPDVKEALIRQSLDEDAAAENTLRQEMKETPPPEEESESEGEVASEKGMEEEVEAGPLPPLDQEINDDDDEEEDGSCETETAEPPPAMEQVTESLPPRPNFLLLSPHGQFHPRDQLNFPSVCTLCSRSFRNEQSLSTHYSGTHGLDLTLSRPLSCPAKGCGRAFPMAKGRLLLHLRTKHPPSVEMTWLKHCLAQDAAAAEGGNLAEDAAWIQQIEASPPPPQESESEEEVAPEDEEEALPSPPLDLQMNDDDEDEDGACEREAVAVGQLQPESLPPRPNFLLINPKIRFLARDIPNFPAVCSLCSRSFRNKLDLSTHYSGTHGLDLTLPRPLSCPVPGCDLAFPAARGRLLLHLRAKHPRSVEMEWLKQNLAQDSAGEGGQQPALELVEETRSISSKKVPLLHRRRRAKHWKVQLKQRTRLLQRGKNKEKYTPPPPSAGSESEEEVSPEDGEEEVEAEPPPLDQETSEDDEAWDPETSRFSASLWEGKSSLPPRPNFLLLPHRRRFQPRNWSHFPAVCSLCSRSFRHKMDLSAHYSGTHGLDLTLPRPLVCPAEGCGRAFPITNGRLLLHLRAKHPLSLEMAWLKHCLAQDAAAEGGLGVVVEAEGNSRSMKASPPHPRRRAKHWKMQLKQRSRLLQRTGEKNNEMAHPPAAAKSEEESEVAPPTPGALRSLAEDATVRDELKEVVVAGSIQPPPKTKTKMQMERVEYQNMIKKLFGRPLKKSGRPPGKRGKKVKAESKIQNRSCPPPSIHWRTQRKMDLLQKENEEREKGDPLPLPSPEEEEQEMDVEQGKEPSFPQLDPELDPENSEILETISLEDEVSSPSTLTIFSPSHQLPPPLPSSSPPEARSKSSSSPTPTTPLKQSAQREEEGELSSSNPSPPSRTHPSSPLRLPSPPPRTRSPTPTLPRKKRPSLTNSSAIAFLTQAKLLGNIDPSRITCPLCPRRKGEGKGKRKSTFANHIHLVHHLHNFCPTWKIQQQQRQSQSPPSNSASPLDKCQSQIQQPAPPPPLPKHKATPKQVQTLSPPLEEKEPKMPILSAIYSSPSLRPAHSYRSSFDRKTVSDLTRWSLLERIDATQIQCPLCPTPSESEKGKRTYSTFFGLWQHLRRSCVQFKLLHPEEKSLPRHTSTDRGEWSCGWCPSAFRAPQFLTRHMNLAHGETVAQEERNAHFQQLKKKLSTCSDCGVMKKGRKEHVCSTSAQQRKRAKAKASPAQKRKIDQSYVSQDEEGEGENVKDAESESERTPNKKMKLSSSSITKTETPPLTPEDEENNVLARFPELKRSTLRLSIARLPDPVVVEEAGSSSEDNSESGTEEGSVSAEEDSEEEEGEVRSPGLRCSTCRRTFMSLNSLWAHEETYKKLGKLCSQKSQSPLSSRKGGGQPRKKRANLEEEEEMPSPTPPFSEDEDDDDDLTSLEDGELVECEFCDDFWFSSEEEKIAHTLQNH